MKIIYVPYKYLAYNNNTLVISLFTKFFISMIRRKLFSIS